MNVAHLSRILNSINNERQVRALGYGEQSFPNDVRLRVGDHHAACVSRNRAIANRVRPVIGIDKDSIVLAAVDGAAIDDIRS